MITWVYGNSGAGKTHVARALVSMYGGVWLDGDAMREVWSDLGFSRADRTEQNMRVARLARELSDQGFDVVVSTIAPYRDLRAAIYGVTKCRFILCEGGKRGDDYPFEMPGMKVY